MSGIDFFTRRDGAAGEGVRYDVAARDRVCEAWRWIGDCGHIIANQYEYQIRPSEQPTYANFTLDPRYNCVPVLAFANAVMVYTELLGDQVDNTALLGGQSPRKREFVAHMIFFEDQDT
jgi:hypothetical protein